MSNSSSEEIQRLGKSKQVSPARKWCFTYFNYDENGELNKFLTLLDPKDLYGYGYEEAPTTKKKHLQGWIEFGKKVRPLSVMNYTENIRWFKMNGTIEQNITYCSKGGEYVTNYFPPENNPIVSISKDDLCGWAEMAYGFFKNKTPGVHWFYTPYGGDGKSSFIHYMLVHHKEETLLLGQGKYADLINGIYNKDMKCVKSILIDLPRRNRGKVSIDAFESILDSHVYNSKFEGGAKVFGKVNIIVMSNSYPQDTEDLSARKWKIYSISGCSRYEEEVE